MSGSPSASGSSHASAPAAAAAGSSGSAFSASGPYKPSAVEPVVTAKWNASGVFHADPQRVLKGEAKPYSIVIPPPNVTGALHLGHALNNTLQDILTRAHRMMGFETLWMPGTDHAGIATQAVVEKRLRKEGKLKGPLKSAMTREQFVEQVQLWKDEYEARITEQLKAMGCSCDFDRQRFTMDDICAKAVREAFFILFRDGLIYRGKRLVNWDPALQTAVADDECYDEETDSSFYFMKYPIVGSTDEFITVATTRPETYLGDTAIAMNPKDPRAAMLVGKKVRLPMVGREIPIIADSYAVLPEAMATTEEEKNDPKAKFSTGFVKMTPAHDFNDYEVWQRNKAHFTHEPVNMMSPDGRVSDQHGWGDGSGLKGTEAEMFLGKTMAEARKMVVAEFKSRRLLEDVKPYRQSLQFSDRSKAVIEPYLSDQWYVRVTDPALAGAANKALIPSQRTSNSQRSHEGVGASASTDGGMTFHPARYAKTFEQWHDNIRDWCISRQLWWGHRIPVVFCMPNQHGQSWKPSDVENEFHRFAKDLGEALTKYLATLGLHDSFHIAWDIWAERPGVGVHVNVCLRSIEALQALDLLNRFDDSANVPGPFPSSEAWIAASELRGICATFQQDPDVLDTWFSSALWPLSTMGWPAPEAQAETAGLLEAFNPTSVLSTAREIITLWVSRMTMMNRYMLPEGWPGARSNNSPSASERRATQGHGRGPVPFRDVFIHAVVQDGDGRKMSKSLGNGVDPLDIIESHGADAMRFTLCQMTTQTQDVRMPVSKDSKTGKNTSPKFDLGRNFCNKLWNATKFAVTFLPQEDGASNSPAASGSSDKSFIASSLPLLDRWMLSRLASTTQRVNANLAAYEFAPYAEGMYDLLWRDLCDWYLEAVKPTIASNPAQQAVLAHALETIVRLLHPITPFITEAIFEQLRTIETAPIGGITLGASRSNGLLASAGWPVIDASLMDANAEREFEAMRSLVVAIRNVRAEHQVLPKRKITLHLSKSAAKTLALSPNFVETMAGLERVAIDEAPGADSVKVAFRALDEEMFLSNLADAIDAGAEKDRLAKELEQLKKSEATLAGRLSNAGYVDRAPAKLVEESKAQLAKIRSEIQVAEAKLNGM
jgi:valyl-tRNA synthetase